MDRRLGSLALCLSLLAGAALAQATQQPAAPKAAPSAPSPPPQTAAPKPPEVEAILQEEESALAGRAYSYDPAGRRDPFRSLLSREVERGRVKPPGVAGLSVDEIILQGIWKTRTGFLAQVRGSDNKSYLLRAGDPLYDGEVVGVRPNELGLRQNITDPQSVKPFREVVKQLNVGKPQ